MTEGIPRVTGIFTSPGDGGQLTHKTDPDRACDNVAPQSGRRRVPFERAWTQVPLDLVDEASMESFPCSDPPGYTACHV